MGLKLVKLTPEYREQLQDMMEEWLAAEQNFSPYAIRKNDYRDFDNYLANLEVKEDTENLVQDSVWFLLDEERSRFLGAVNIRHRLAPCVAHTGGHIGDGIRPSERRKGYATLMIGLALEKCRELGMKKVLMTCDTDNIGSAKSIIKNGGVPELIVEDDGVPEQRYWITLEDEKVESQRLLLRRILPGDYREVFNWSSDARVYRYLLSQPVEKPENLIGWLEQNDPNAPDRYVMICRSKEDGRAIGTVGMFYQPEEDIWDFAYNFLYDEWGKGYATEATGAMMDYLRREKGAKGFEAECAEDNIGSRRVMEKLGLSFVRESSYSKNDGSETFRSRVYRTQEK